MDTDVFITEDEEKKGKEIEGGESTGRIRTFKEVQGREGGGNSDGDMSNVPWPFVNQPKPPIPSLVSLSNF